MSLRSVLVVMLLFIARENATLKTGRIMNKTVFEMSSRYELFYNDILHNLIFLHRFFSGFSEILYFLFMIESI